MSEQLGQVSLFADIFHFYIELSWLIIEVFQKLDSLRIIAKLKV